MFKGLSKLLLPRIKGFTDKVASYFSPSTQAAPTNDLNTQNTTIRVIDDKSGTATTYAPGKKAVISEMTPSPTMTQTPKQEVPQTISNPINNPAPIVKPTSAKVMSGRNPAFTAGKYKAQPNVAQAINDAATKYGIPPELLFDIAAQESSLDPSKINVNAASGLNPSGLFQFTDDTWRNILGSYNNKPGMSLNLPNSDRFDPYTNALAAAYLIKNGQLGKWDASEDVWGNYWTPEELEQLGFYKQSIYHTPGVRSSVRLTGGNK